MTEQSLDRAIELRNKIASLHMTLTILTQAQMSLKDGFSIYINNRYISICQDIAMEAIDKQIDSVSIQIQKLQTEFNQL